MSAIMTPAGHTRRRSRSNSTSSSLLTVKKSASLSSRSNPRASAALVRTRQASPDLVPLEGDLLAPRSLSQRRGSSDDGRSVYNRNINRWSHSTSSSVTAIDTEALRKRLQDSSRRLSTGPGFSTGANQSALSPQKSREPSQNRLVKRVDAKQPSPTTKQLSAGQTSQQKSKSPNVSTASITPTSMYNTTSGDYFGETWHHRKQSSKFGEPIAAMAIQYTQQKPRRLDDIAQPTLAAPQHIAMQTPNEPPIQQVVAQSTEHRKSRGHRSPTQKTMLSKALAMANNAVLLDNVQNIDGAIEAYAEACTLLEQVMMRSSDGDDRKKLSAIKSTYSNRIAELYDLDDPFANLMNKELPEDPPIEELSGTYFGSPSEQTATEVLEQVRIPPRQESLLPQIFGGERYLPDPLASTKPVPSPINNNLSVPLNSKYAPPPLSPRRPPSPGSSAAETLTPVVSRPDVVMAHHVREDSTESTSWLDTIDDAESSHSSSRLSMFGYEQKSQSNNIMDEIEAEFDAALNAAVDAAYDSDMDPGDAQRLERKHESGLAQQLRTKANTKPREESRGRTNLDQATRGALDDDTTDEEERLLDEMTQGYVLDDFQFDNKSKSALPRQSDSSTFSHRTFSSSVPSATLTNGTSLSTLAEIMEPPKPPPTRDIPPPPVPAADPFDHRSKAAWSNNLPGSPPKSEKINGVNLRDRRLSGQSARQLKIETYAPARGTFQPPQKPTSVMPKLEIPSAIEPQRGVQTAPLLPTSIPMSCNPAATHPATPMTSVHSGSSQASDSPATPALTQSGSQDEITAPSVSPSKLGRMMPPSGPIRKNLSSASLRMRNLSAATNEESPITPGSAQFPPDGKKAAPPLPTPTNTVFTHHPTQSGGMYLFEDHIGTPVTPKTPRTPNALALANPAAPLEPCPESFLLRPWWLMRCLYGVISHPRGGYISTKLFVPRDIWRVKNVKLKFLDDKVSQCDLLTAALMKLAKVNEFDADAVLDELQSFESVLDQVRSVLQKKLGNEVGLSSSTNVFKSPNEEVDSKGATAGPAKNSFASSWRKLRSKSSNAAIPSSTNLTKGDGTASGLTMSSLPMTTNTSVPSSRSYNRRTMVSPPTPTQLTNIPIPHATYMSSLARLFDAVQILDSIARQAEDPGLKRSSATQVGLELGIRSAAEFFAFFILRFVMNDVGILIDKFLKRGTEWVLA